MFWSFGFKTDVIKVTSSLEVVLHFSEESGHVNLDLQLSTLIKAAWSLEPEYRLFLWYPISVS